MKVSLVDLGVGGLLAFILCLAGFYIYIYIDETLVYGEIENGIIPKEPFDKIDRIDLFGKAIDGWYIANVFVVDSETNDFDNSMVRYNREDKIFVIPSEQLGLESCIDIKPCDLE